MRLFRNCLIALFLFSLIYFQSCNIGKKTTAVSKNITPVDTVVKVKVDTEYYSTVQIPAIFQGGDIQNFISYLKKSIKYPPVALKKRQQGTVVVQFGVNWNGEIEVFSILKKSGFPMLDQEAVRAIKSSPQWEPARMEDTKVGQLFVLQIKFDARTRKIEIK
jgi:TonB family protein